MHAKYTRFHGTWSKIANQLMIIPRLHIEAALFLLRIIASKASRQKQPQKLKKQPLLLLLSFSQKFLFEKWTFAGLEKTEESYDIKNSRERTSQCFESDLKMFLKKLINNFLILARKLLLFITAVLRLNFVSDLTKIKKNWNKRRWKLKYLKLWA